MKTSLLFENLHIVSWICFQQPHLNSVHSMNTRTLKILGWIFNWKDVIMIDSSNVLHYPQMIIIYLYSSSYPIIPPVAFCVYAPLMGWSLVWSKIDPKKFLAIAGCCLFRWFSISHQRMLKPLNDFLALVGLFSLVFNIATEDANATCLLVTKLQIDKVALLSLHQLKLHLILNIKNVCIMKTSLHSQ